MGFSYLLTPKTVIQSGFYMVYLVGGAYEYGTAQSGLYMTSLLDGEFSRNTTNSSAPGYGNWDASPMPLPHAHSLHPEIGNGNGFVVKFSPKYDGHAPYDQAWNFSVQRQLPWNMFLTVAYVGNRAIHLPVTLIQPNQAPLSVLNYGNLLGELVHISGCRCRRHQDSLSRFCPAVRSFGNGDTGSGSVSSIFFIRQ